MAALLYHIEALFATKISIFLNCRCGINILLKLLPLDLHPVSILQYVIRIWVVRSDLAQPALADAEIFYRHLPFRMCKNPLLSPFSMFSVVT